MSAKPSDTQITHSLEDPPNEKRTKLSLNPSDFDAFGFDMDHTLLEYHLEYQMEAVYEGIQEYMEQNCSISKDLFCPYADIKHMFFRGVIIDVDRGYVLQADKAGVITRAFYGLSALAKETRTKLYGEGPWSEWDKVFKEYIKGNHPDPNMHVDEHTSGTYFVIDTEFGTPGAGVFSCLVESVKDSEIENMREQYNIFYRNIARAYSYLYRDINDGKKSFFRLCLNNSDKYVKKIAKETIDSLKALKSKGKCVFLLTTSNYAFANSVLKIVYGEEWRELFTVVLAQARKPKYFRIIGQNLYRLSTTDSDKVETDAIESGGVYCQGNIEHLVKFLEKFTQKENPTVLYVGDSLTSDVYWTEKIPNWKCACVIQNLPSFLKEETKDVAATDNQFIPNSNLTTPSGVNAFWYDRILSLSYLLANNVAAISQVLTGEISVEDSSDVITGYSI